MVPGSYGMILAYNNVYTDTIHKIMQILTGMKEKKFLKMTNNYDSNFFSKNIKNATPGCGTS